nr:MAG TPA: hypothetical protein [Caudoviricetes sp.]
MPIIEPSPYLHCLLTIFYHQEDESELRGATPNFSPQYNNKLNYYIHKPAWECLPINFTVRSELLCYHYSLNRFTFRPVLRLL